MKGHVSDMSKVHLSLYDTHLMRGRNFEFGVVQSVRRIYRVHYSHMDKMQYHKNMQVVRPVVQQFFLVNSLTNETFTRTAWRVGDILQAG